jgi:tRNA_anti-like
MKILKWTAIALGSLFTLGLVGSWISPPPKVQAAQAAPAIQGAQVNVAPVAKAVKPPVLLPAYTALDIQQAYEANTVAADMKFKGQRFEVSGTIKDINTNAFGEPYLMLKAGNNDFSSPHFNFEKQHLMALSVLKKGQKVKLICEGSGDVMKVPTNKNCQLL